MKVDLKRQSPAVTGLYRGTTFAANYTTVYCTTSAQLPKNWRVRLPDPARYFAQRVEALGKHNSAGWARGRCPFHQDTNASLSVNITDARGGWRCFAGCGSGDMIGFHQQLRGLSFLEAIHELIGGE